MSWVNYRRSFGGPARSQSKAREDPQPARDDADRIGDEQADRIGLLEEDAVDRRKRNALARAASA